MTKVFPIQLKAALLLIIFCLNMIVGVACTMGEELGFTVSYHPEEGDEVHVITNGNNYHHKEKSEQGDSHKESKEGCCNDKVLKISLSDKSVIQPVKLLNPVFFTAFLTVYYDYYIHAVSQTSVSCKYFVRGHHPPIPDIRIAIRSFQI